VRGRASFANLTERQDHFQLLGINIGRQLFTEEDIGQNKALT
jgi:hypothetical protein